MHDLPHPLPEIEPAPPLPPAPRPFRLRRLWKWAWEAALLFFAVTILGAIIFRFVPLPVSGLQLYRCGEAIFSGNRPRLEKDWVGMRAISPHLKQAAMAAEDQRFIEHYGFDFEAIEKAIDFNERNTRRKKGASTISQQTAKNVFLWPSRSWLRKGMEVYFTLLIETLWSKERILHVYLNVAEFGDGIYGVEAASRKYFRKPASQVSRPEAALLISILPNPRKWSPTAPTPYVLRRQEAILRAMNNLGPQEGITEKKTEKSKP